MIFTQERGVLQKFKKKINLIHIFIQFLVSCLEHLYRETEKESTKYPCALDSRGTILEKEIKQTNVTAC